MTRRVVRAMMAGKLGVFGGSIFTLTRSTSGLIFADDFNRANQDGLGNSWAVTTNGAGATDYQIVSNRAECQDAGTKNLAYQDIAHAGDFIVQANIQLQDATSGGLGILARCSDMDNQGTYDAYKVYTDNNKIWRTQKATNGATANLDSAAGADTAIDVINFRMARLVGEISGTDLLLRSYCTPDLATAQTQDVDPTLRVAEVTEAAPLTGSQFGFQCNNLGLVELYFLCGRSLTISGLRDNDTVTLDARSPVSETAGTVTIAMDTYAMPASTLTVKDVYGSTVATLTPSGGIYGGDVFALA